MEQLIFFAVIIIFSILDSVARSRKKKQQQGTGLPAPTKPGRRRAVPRYDTEATHEPKPTYESERTYESQPSYDAEPSYDVAPSYDDDVPDEAGSGGLIPSDIWKEIEALATGRPPARRRPPPPPVELEAIPARPVETHRVHRAHVEYGTDPSSRARSAQDGLDPLARSLGADAAAVRKQLRSRSAHALRQAVILQEVLGPPAAMRPDPGSE